MTAGPVSSTGCGGTAKRAGYSKIDGIRSNAIADFAFALDAYAVRLRDVIVSDDVKPEEIRRAWEEVAAETICALVIASL